MSQKHMPHSTTDAHAELVDCIDHTSRADIESVSKKPQGQQLFREQAMPRIMSVPALPN
jgi:ubiquinone biosynthesis protein Coq4